MRYLVSFCRLAVGVIFIISGLIKLNDPLGFSFKLEEYFSEAVLDLPFLMPYALGLSIFVVILEVVLGVMLLLGFQKKFTVWSLLLLIIFFTFLTFYSAYFNKVTDCGCFGDAIKLTPWESFTKDLVLLILIGVLYYGMQYITPVLRPRATRILVAISLLASIWFGYYVLNHLPLKDFRPYKIGANIQQGMEIPEDAPKPVFEYSWRFRNNGQDEVIITNGDYPSVEGEFIGVETKEIQPGYEPPIHDFSLEREGMDFTYELLEKEKLMMVVAYDLAKTETAAYQELKITTDQALEAGYTVIGMSASGVDWTGQFQEMYKLGFPFYFTDETTLKTIVRSNPGVLVLERGTIVEKVHYNDLDRLKLGAP